MEMKQSGKSRIAYFDILRVMACFSVVMIHTCIRYLKNDIGSFNFWTANALDSLSRIGVPIFVMLSGALMLDRNYEFSTKKLTVHIKRMLFFFLFWSVVYCVFNSITGALIYHQPIEWRNVIKSLIKGDYHLWFVYLIVGLYLIVPLLRLWVKEENKKYIEYFIILSLIFTYLIPQIIIIGTNYSTKSIFEFFNDILATCLQLKYVGGFTTYFILGWYLHNFDIKNKKFIYIIGVLGFLTSFLGTYIVSASVGEVIKISDNLSINVLCQSLAVFVFVKEKLSAVPQNKIVFSISKHSLGIYAMHVMIIAMMYRIVEMLDFNIAIIYIPIVFIPTLVLSYFMSLVFSKLPILNKFV